MASHEQLVNTINEYMEYHRFSKTEFCRIAGLDPIIFEKIIHHEHYIPFSDLQKLAFILNIPLIDTLTF